MKKVICYSLLALIAFFISSCSNQNPIEVKDTQKSENQKDDSPTVQARLKITQNVDDGNGGQTTLTLVDQSAYTDGSTVFDSGINDFEVNSHTTYSFDSQIWGLISVQPPGIRHISFYIYTHNQKTPSLIWYESLYGPNNSYYKDCGNEPGLESGNNIYAWRIVITNW